MQFERYPCQKKNKNVILPYLAFFSPVTLCTLICFIWPYLFFQVGVYAPKDKIATAQFALDAAVKILDYYEQFFKVPYPLPKQGEALQYNISQHLLYLLAFWVIFAYSF